MTKTRADAIALLDELATLPFVETPAIDDLIAGCAALSRSDWINRYGPADEWRHIAVRYATPVLSWLIRVIVTAERELKWLGGSVASSIWLFREYQDRPDGDPERLAAWIFLNRGNDYLPFGGRTGVLTVAERRAQQAMKPARRVAHEEHHRQLGAAKAQRLRERAEREQARRQEGSARKRQIANLVAKVAAMPPAERLALLARDHAVPLGALPESLITSCHDCAADLPAEVRHALARRIDRRQARHWKLLRERLG